MTDLSNVDDYAGLAPGQFAELVRNTTPRSTR
jgi:hypothetical protein